MSDRTALFVIDDYIAVIPHVQNLYKPEKESHVDAWFWGFKYKSGVFEYFTAPTHTAASLQFEMMANAVDSYWCFRQAGQSLMFTFVG